MTDPHRLDPTDPAIDGPSTERSSPVRLLPLVGACLACCVPMLLILGVVSVGAALAGAVGLAVLVAIVAAAAMLGGRRRRRS